MEELKYEIASKDKEIDNKMSDKGDKEKEFEDLEHIHKQRIDEIKLSLKKQ